MIEQNLQAAPYRRIVALDIETVCLDPNVPKGALDALTGRIVCVCLLIDDGSTLKEVAIADEDEAKILTDFWSTVRATDLFVGHNILDFDLCFIRQRSWILGIRPSRTVDLRRFYTLDVKDVMQLWCNWGFKKGVSLDALASALGCGQKTGHGENVQEWWAIRDLDTIGRPAVTGVQQEIIDEERRILIRIFQSYANGYSLSRIAKMLNAEGVPSPQRPKRRTPRSWCPSGIRDILRNERYRGVIVWNRTHKVRNPETGRKETRWRPETEWVRTERPELRIIAEELWMRVQNQIKLVSEKWGPKRIGGFYRTKKSSTYLFSGLLVCGVCGGGMTVTGSDNGGTRTIYGCFAHRFRGVCPNDLNFSGRCSNDSS